MARAVHDQEVDEEGLAEVLRPRDDLLLERPVAEHEYACLEGPFTEYRRAVEVRPQPDDRFSVTETTYFKMAVPVWGWLFVLPVRHALRRRRPPGEMPWWSPPDRMDRRASTVLGLLCGLSIVVAYQLTLLSQTITFAADEFGSTNTQQGLTLAGVRIGVLASLALITLADRRGRRRMLLVSLALGCVATASTALAPGLPAFGVSQTLTRGLATTAAVLLGIVAVEEMPAGSRAYSVSVMALSGSLGAGLVLVTLPLADLAEGAWRILFLFGLPMLLAVRAMGRRLPESKRFLQAEQTDLDDLASHEPEARRQHRRRLLILGVSGLLVTVFTAPANQFFNEFLRDERDFSAGQITLFQVMTNLPGGIGIVVGGRLADTRGRRLVGSVGLIGGVGATVIMYNVVGWSMALWSVVGAVLGAAVVPALGVYGPELFPTNMRGKANSGLTVLGVVGAVTGLALAGVLSDHVGGLGPAMTVLAIGPAVAAAMVLLFYPETAHRELEDINPEDAVLSGLPLDPVDDPRPEAPSPDERS